MERQERENEDNGFAGHKKRQTGWDIEEQAGSIG